LPFEEADTGRFDSTLPHGEDRRRWLNWTCRQNDKLFMFSRNRTQIASI